MAIKDYWVYQKRDVATPWALYIVKEYDRRYPEVTTIDYTFYHEDIPTATHSKSFVGLHHANAKGYADAITAEMEEYVAVEESDYAQVERAIDDILVS